MIRHISLCAVAAVTSLLIAAPAARADIVIPAVDLDVLEATGMLGDLVAGPVTDDFLTPPDPSTDIGDLTNTVFFSSGTATTGPVFTYVHEVTPSVFNVSEFNTGFDLNDRGFNLIAGFSFSDALAAGGTGTLADFTITWNNDTDGTLDWEATLPILEFFDAGETIRFFFQSTQPPSAGEFFDYNIINSEVGTAQSFGPSVIPTPAALPAGLIGMALLALTGRRRRYRTAPIVRSPEALTP